MYRGSYKEMFENTQGKMVAMSAMKAIQQGKMSADSATFFMSQQGVPEEIIKWAMANPLPRKK